MLIRTLGLTAAALMFMSALAGGPIRPAWGLDPSKHGGNPFIGVWEQKLYRTVSWPLLSTSNTVTQPLLQSELEFAPPDVVVPNRLPVASRMSPAWGVAPSAQLEAEQKL